VDAAKIGGGDRRQKRVRVFRQSAKGSMSVFDATMRACWGASGSGVNAVTSRILRLAAASSRYPRFLLQLSGSYRPPQLTRGVGAPPGPAVSHYSQHRRRSEGHAGEEDASRVPRHSWASRSR